MRELDSSVISDHVARMCQDANIYLGEDVFKALQSSLEKEESAIGKEVLRQLIENAEIAGSEQIPICQDTGFAVFFVEWGQEVHLNGGTLEEAIHAGVRRGYQEGYLRKSIVDDPLYKRKNTGDNTPAIIYTELVSGDKVRISFAPKGGGSENMSAVKMLTPSDGEDGVVDFVVNHVKAAGPNPCPPIVVGVGIGGTFDRVAVLAKKALFRAVGQPHPDGAFAALEKKILDKVNDLGVGPQGFGGRVTALAVHIETFPSHIASLAAAVNINCHASRHLECEI
ncbi:MAG TPA: fumarate hydratase [Candidatus Limnocylindrales bacterium]|nr:fumarate hydratase [Candidatus Limnocylindrales bacterium]